MSKKSKHAPTITTSTKKTSREFNYTRGGVKLDFTLRNDIPDFLFDFLELLKLAEKEVSEELATFKAHELKKLK